MNFFRREESKQVSKGLFEKELTELLKSSKENPKECFTVQNVEITPKDIQDLASAITTAKELKKLVLNGNHFNNSTQLTPLFEAIKSNSSLKVVNLSDNSFGDDGVHMLSQVVKYKHNIVEVYLSDVGMTQIGAQSIKSMLEINKNINVLDVSKNMISDAGVKVICSGILATPLGDFSKLLKLDLSDTEMSDEGAKIVGAIIASNITLKELFLTNNKIGKVGAKYISHGLMKKQMNVYSVSGEVLFQGLEVLNLSKNPLGDDGIAQISKRLPANAALKKLFLNCVRMTKVGFEKLGKSLTEAENLESLAMGENPIEENTLANVVIPLITNSPRLASLDLSGISISSEDMKTIGEFIGERIKCRLSELNLSDTNMTDEGAVHVAQGLRHNMEMQVLKVISNPFGPKGARAFARTFRRAKPLKEFHITGQSRIEAEGENYLAESLKFHKKLKIYGASKELDYIRGFLDEKKAFVLNSKGELQGWSEEAWEVVKRGCGQIIATVLLRLSKKEKNEFKRNVIFRSRNVVNQDMFEYVLRHAQAPALEVVSVFVNQFKVSIDCPCTSKASTAMMKEKPKTEDATYREVAKECSQDPMVRAMAKNKRLFLGRYITEQGPAVHETHEIIRFKGRDTLATGKDKDKTVFVQIYENENDFENECAARNDLKSKIAAAGPFALDDTLLKEIETHDENNVISFMSNITDLRHSINNLGVTSGYDLRETARLARRAAKCLSTINSFGRIHGDFKPRNFVMVARKRHGDDPTGKTSKKVLLEEKWVVFDLSKSIPHGEAAALRMNSSYVPPEVARVMFNTNLKEKQLPVATEKMDVWSFGVVLYQLLTGVHLFHSETNTDRMFRASERLELMNWINLDSSRQSLVLHRACESRFANKTTFERIKKAALDLVNWCLQGDPHNRPSFNEILDHPFFVYKTYVNYTDVDLLLGWYKKVGANAVTAEHKNNRTHAHVVNTAGAATTDVFNVLKYYYSKAGCTITCDAGDGKLDVSARREKVQKARSLIILLENGIFWEKKVMQKILWAMDSIETSNLLLVDISTSYTNTEKFNFDQYFSELDTPEGKKKLSSLVDELLPISKKLKLENLPYEKSENKQKKWLTKYIMEDVYECLNNLKNQVIPYRSRDFQTEAMIDEMLKRSGFIDVSQLRKFDLSDNEMSYQVEEEEEEEEAESKKNADKEEIKILVLYNEETNQVPLEKIQGDALSLRHKLVKLDSKKLVTDIQLIGDPQDVYKFFSIVSNPDPTKNGSNRVLKAEERTIVLCLVAQGFYERFREQILLLNNAQGSVAVLPISYDYFDVAGEGREEVLNLGLENANVLEKLKDNRSYIPLPRTEANLKYETEAALKYIVGETEKMIEITRENEQKDENDLYTRYTKTNFFADVY